METKTMPKSITAMRTMTYNTQQIIESIAEASGNGIIYQDENGGDINE